MCVNSLRQFVPLLATHQLPNRRLGEVLSNIRDLYVSKKKFKTATLPGNEKITPANPLQDAFIRLDQSERLRQAGQFEKAKKTCLALLKDHPNYMAALHTMGLIYAGMSNYEQSLNCLARAAMYNPRSIATLTALSGVYLELKAPETAAYVLEQARALDPKDVNVLVTLGEVYRAEMEYADAKQVFEEAQALDTDLVPATTGYGWACSSLGENVDAVATFERLLNTGYRRFEPLAALAALPTALLKVDLLEELDTYTKGSDLSDSDPTMIAFVRAAALDKAERYQEAWDTLTKVNEEMAKTSRESAERFRERQNKVLTVLRSNPIKPAIDAEGETTPTMLFVLGPSRSGKTSMETMMAGLEGVKRGYENPCVDLAIRQTFQGAGLLTNRFFEVLPPQLYPQCRKIYLEELNKRAGDAKVFTNTHPSRINDAALMSMVFPNTKFVFVKRDPEDIAFRIFLRHYQNENSYSYDMGMIREHIGWYHEMMDLMQQKNPENVRIVHYEDMVDDPVAALKVVADLCGLPMPRNPDVSVGDDRGCAAPYRDMMATI